MFNAKFLLIIGLVVPTILYGQKIGINIGLGTSNLYTLQKSSGLPDYHYSFSYSATFNWWGRISDKIFITPGLGLSKISTTYTNPYGLRAQENAREKLNLVYIQLPLRFNVLLFDKFILYSGPRFGYRVSDKTNFVDDTGANYIQYIHVYDDKKLDYGLELGLGVRFSSRFIAGLNMYNGFSNVDKLGTYRSRVRSFEMNFNYLLIK